jgi:hypothetical protein
MFSFRFWLWLHRKANHRPGVALEQTLAMSVPENGEVLFPTHGEMMVGIEKRRWN